MATTTPSTPVATPKKRHWGDIATVTLVVGEAETTFQVHEAELFEASPVFKAAFNSDFRESSERKMNLPEDDPDIFNLMVEWLYSHRYDILQPTGDKIRDETRFMEPMRLYVLADKYGMTSLKGCIANIIFKTLKPGNVTGPSIETIAYAYQNVPQTSGIRRLLADLYACNINFDWYKSPIAKPLLQKYPEFATDIILSFARHTSREGIKNPFKGEMPEAYKE
ncbi:hypothetical protein HO173_009073 [Letharia columbiana]|uniref:BTB domain-containing protein n=1 Tax=Letharia columbiana TaxID=112416 RepID=A0A8H6FQ36_9LECA|nr:uncharacterized protein HO173_009073 [Letharia columbiana]KAF6232634.1 hypothetical protein HO173_009073 [Letharia columbiana]